MKFQIHAKEKMYFAIMIAVSLVAYAALISTVIYAAAANMALFGGIMIMSMYVGIFILIRILGHLFFIGHIRGNGVRIHQKQFPEIFEVIKSQSEKLGLQKVPTVYLLQGNGILNAFATRFKGQNYVILYSDVLAAAYNEGMPAVTFIIGHELGHIKRNHVSGYYSLLLFPSKLIPFLGWAYSRAREYTCDNIGFSACPEGAHKGLLILAAGPDLYKKVSINELLFHAQNVRGFAFWFAEIFSTHPHLVKRLASLEKLNQSTLPENTFVIDKDKEAVRQFDDLTV